MATVESGLNDRGVAIDEHAVLIDAVVRGADRVWRAERTDRGVEVTTAP